MFKVALIANIASKFGYCAMMIISILFSQKQELFLVLLVDLTMLMILMVIFSSISFCFILLSLSCCLCHQWHDVKYFFVPQFFYLILFPLSVSLNQYVASFGEKFV